MNYNDSRQSQKASDFKVKQVPSNNMSLGANFNQAQTLQDNWNK